MAVKLYDLKNVVCTVGGVTISGYGEEDAVRFEWLSERVEQILLVDGSVVAARSNDRRLLAIVTLMQTSSAIPLLRAQFELQHGLAAVAAGGLLPLPFYLVDPGLGDYVSGSGLFLNEPNFGKGRQIGEIEYRLLLPSPTVQLGTFNVG